MGGRNRLLLTGLSAGYLATVLPWWHRFARAAARPWRTQASLLRAFLERHAESLYGRAHRFADVRSVSAFQDRVPIVDYEALRPWVDRIAAGEPDVLGPEPVRVMERSSGTSGGDKLIPYTPELLAEFSRATGAWLGRMYATRPRLIGTTSYWSLSPAARSQETTRGGIPIGFADDTEYFGPFERWALRRMMAVPGTVARIPDVDAWRRTTAEHLMSASNLGLISVWNPSFLTLLMNEIDRPPHELWPRLALISCWTDGHAARFVPEMASHFPGVEIEGKGLLATEGVVSFPIGGACAAALTSHFLEFEDRDHPGRRPRLIDELRQGARYVPILTTGNGFARYRLSDEIECTGHYRATPTIRFVGRLDAGSDLCGEKLTRAEADRAVDRASAAGGPFTFALIAPTEDPPRYVLYVEGARAPEDAAEAVEAVLMENHHYRYCRDLGQLGPVIAVEVADGRRAYERALVARGVKAGDIKPTHLDARPIWSDVFVTQ